MARQLLAAAAALLVALLPVSSPTRSVLAADETSPDPVREVLEFLAAVEGLQVVSDGQVVSVVDPVGDSGTSWGHDDLTGAAMAFLPEVPDWMLDGPFACGADNTACPSTGSSPDAFADGAYLFYQRLVSPPGVIPAGQRGEWGPVLALAEYPPAPAESGNPFGGASHAVITRVEGTMRDVLYFAYLGQFSMYRTSARSMWSGNEIMTLVPRAKEIQTDVLAWDTYAFGSDGTSTGRDMARDLDGGELMAVDRVPEVRFEAAAPSATPSATPTPTATPSSAPPSAAASAAPTAAPEASGTPAPSGESAGSSGLAGLWDNLLVRLVLGMLLAVIGLVLLLGWLRRRSGGGPEAGSGGPAPAPAGTPGNTPGTPGPSDGPPDGPDSPGPGPGGPVVDGGDPTPTPPVPPVPPGPGGGPGAPPPPAGGCTDGDEEWRPERPAESFLVPPPDGKVRITADPSAPALEAWLDGFGLPRGIPFDDFVAADDARLDELLAGLPAGEAELHWVIEFQLDEYRLECQRKWVCEAGVYVPTDETRLLETGPDPHLARYAVDGPAREVADIRDAWRDAQVVLNGAESNVPAMEAYRTAC